MGPLFGGARADGEARGLALLPADERDEGLVVLRARGAVAQVRGEAGEDVVGVAAGELELDVLGDHRHASLAAGVLARGAEQPRQRVAFVHLVSTCSRCPSRSRRRRSFPRASSSTFYTPPPVAS